MIRVADMTLDKFNETQRGGIAQANMERTARGLPQWEVADYVRVHRNKFPDVDFAQDDHDAAERAANAAMPAQRVDQRQV